MISAWFKHLKDQKDIEHFQDLLKSPSITMVLARLRELIKDEEGSLDRSEMNAKTFENANWAYLQAYKNGYRSALSTINKLITLDQQKD